MKNSLSIFNNNKWCIVPERLSQLQNEARLSAEDIFNVSMPDTKIDYQNYNAVAVIPIKGIISKDVSAIEKVFFDVTDINEISAMFEKALSDETVTSIVLDINSPGGIVTGVPELHDKILNSSKPVIAYVDSMCASAAMWIASAAQAIYATKSAELGSIGCFISVIDSTKYYEMNGFKNQMIVSEGCIYKGAGADGTSLTLEQKSELQKQADYIYTLFCDALIQRRKIDESAMLGQTFIGAQAIVAGMADNLVEDITTAIADCQILTQIG